MPSNSPWPSVLRLMTHPRQCVVSHAGAAIEMCRDQGIPDEVLEQPITALIEFLDAVCEDLPSKDAVPRHTILYHLRVIKRTIDLATSSSFQRLGAGSFATVFVSADRGSVVIKQVKDPSTASTLQQEHSDLQSLHASCAAGEHLFKLPAAHGFFDTYHSFAQYACIPPTMDLGLPPHAMYVMQRIWPVSPSVSNQVASSFFPQHEQDGCPAFLARLYLGKRGNPEDPRAGGRFFSNENFPLDQARIEHLQLPASDIAKGMGTMLACIHFSAGLDGRDIEFVLCGNGDNPLSKEPSYACIDFNQTQVHAKDEAAVQCLVSGIMTNDPYYPRPGSPYWQTFVDAYTEHAGSYRDLASKVVSELLARSWTMR